MPPVCKAGEYHDRQTNNPWLRPKGRIKEIENEEESSREMSGLE
jgi:hypothetical protein